MHKLHVSCYLEHLHESGHNTICNDGSELEYNIDQVVLEAH